MSGVHTNAGTACVRITSTQRVLGESVTASTGGTTAPALLAETGVETLPLSIAAALLLGFGIFAVVFSRRSRDAVTIG